MFRRSQPPWSSRPVADARLVDPSATPAAAAGRGLSMVTPAGWLVVSICALAGATGLRLGWVEVTVGAATGLLTFGLCWLFTIGRTSVEVTLRLEPRRITGGRAAGEVAIRNLVRTRMLPVTVEIPVGDTVEPFVVPGLSGRGGQWTGRFDVPRPPGTATRGVIQVGPVVTVRGDPLGLLRRRVQWREATELFVHPVTVPIDPIGTGLLRDLEGQSTPELTMSGLAFHALRSYEPGDDRRYIHWRSSAKVMSRSAGTQTSTFLVRQFLDTRRTHLLVVVDGDASAYRDPLDFEIAISAGVSVACRAIDDEMDTTVVVAGQAAHECTKQHMLDQCARAVLGTMTLTDLVGRGVRLAPETTSALIVTGARPTLGDLQRIATRLSSEVSTVAIQVDPSGRRRVGRVGLVHVLPISRLGDLARRLRTASEGIAG